jgi:ADP-ribose pyrophosphatase YjhB (NUDIX family)
VDFEISKTNYFNSILTHEIYPHSIVVGGVAANQRDEAFRRAAEEVLICDVRDGIPSARALVDLADSRMSNHFGINTLVFKRQEGFIVQRQSVRNLIVPGKLVPTGSGSSDWKSRGRYRKLRGPLRPGADFKHILQCEAYRELAEETRIRFSLEDVSNIEILGMARDLNRGGKPDFFFAYALPENSSDNEAELRRRANRFLNKELLFVDDFTSDLALGYFFKPEERLARQVKYNEQSENIRRSFEDEINAKSEGEYVRQILSRISPRAFKQEFVPTADELLAARRKPQGEIPESYWVTMLKLIRWHPEAGQPLQVNAHLLLKRFEIDPDFRRRFFAPQIQNRKPGESAGEHFESDD